MYTKRTSGFLSLVLTLSMVLAACGPTTPPIPQETQAPIETEAPAVTKAPAAQTDTKDGEAIKKVAAGIDAAWNKGDAIALAAHWAEDGTVVNPMGEITVGRAEIEKNMAAEFAGPMKGTKHKLTVTRIYWLKPDVAVVDGEVEVTPVSSPNGNVMPPWKANFTAIFAKDRGGKWVLSHLRSYTFVQPPPSTAG
jgi:uncharacterized protein (TIGR02246 family)